MANLEQPRRPEKGSLGEQWAVQDAKAAPQQQCMETHHVDEHQYCQEAGTIFRPVFNVTSSRSILEHMSNLK